MSGVYNIVKEVKEILLADGLCNQVGYGDLSEAALRKLNVYPYAHITLGNADLNDSTTVFNLFVICMDIVDISKEDITDLAIGNDNEQDALQTTLTILERLVTKFSRGDIRDQGYHLEGTPSAEPFFDSYADNVAGWTLSLAITYRTNMDKC